METETRTVEFEGSPYFVLERESGVFQVVRAIDLEIKKNTRFSSYQIDENKLELGLDLIEIPARITLAVRSPKIDHSLPYVVAELKKLAQITGTDYFSYELFGNSFSVYRIGLGEYSYLGIKPRLFRIPRDN